jgi:hypothetical protein
MILRSSSTTESVIVSADGATKTYINTKHGFTFEYPASFDLAPPWEPQSAALEDETLSAEEREAIWQQYEDEYLAELRQINGGLLKLGEGKEYREIDVTVIDPMTLPTLEEERARCAQQDALVEKLSAENPEGPHEGPMGCPDEKEGVLRESVFAEQKAIAELPLGTNFNRTSNDLDDGEIIEVNGIRGLRGMTLGSGSGAYRASFVTYNTAGERIDIDIELYLDAEEYPESVSADDTAFLEKAESDPRNEMLDQLISTFRFLE